MRLLNDTATSIMYKLWQHALFRPENNPKPHMSPITAPLEDFNDLQVRVLMYLGVLCSGILESLADVEKAAVAALSAPHHQKRVWTAIKRALHISSNKVDDPEDPSGTCSARKKQALHQTWLDMLSATNTAFQNGTDYLPSLDILM